MDIVYEYYRWFSNYISIIPLIIGIIKIKKLNRAFLFFLAMVLVETIIAIIAKWFVNNGLNNRFLLHILTFSEILLAGPFFYLVLKNIKLKVSVLVLSTLFLIYTSYNSIFVQELTEYIQIPRMLEGYILVIFSFFYFYELLIQEKVINLWHSAEFWAVTGFFTYFGTTQFLHLFAEYLINQHLDIYFILNEVNRFMIILYYTFFTISLWKKQ